MVRDFASYADDDDPALVELEAAELLVEPADGELDVSDAILRVLIPDMLLRPGRGALTLLLAISHLFDGPAGRAARLAAAGMIAEGIECPAWTDEFELEVTAENCVRIGDDRGIISLLGADFHRGQRGHSVVIAINHLDDRAERVVVLPESGLLPGVMEELLSSAPTEMVREEISSAAFRRLVQEALDGPLPLVDDANGDEGQSDAAGALVLRAWLRKLSD